MKLPTVSLFTSIFSKLLPPSNLLSLIVPSTKDYSFFFYPKRLWEQVFSRFELKIMCGKESSKWFNFALLKRRKEVKEDPHLVTNEKRRRRFPCLVANGRRMRRFPCLEANGRRRKRFFFTSSHFPPKQLYLDLRFFSFDIKVLLYHGSRLLFTHLFLFPWPINYDCTFWCHKSPTHSLSIRSNSKSLIFSLKLWHYVRSHFMGLKLHKWMKSRPPSHF